MRLWFTSAALAAALLFCAACSGPKRVVPVTFLTFEGETMGTTYSVRVERPPERFTHFPETLGEIVEAELLDVDMHMSTYRDDSDLSRFNQLGETTPFTIPPPLYGVLERAQKVSEETGGAFDITVGPLVNAWGFGPDGRPETVPDDAAIESLKTHVGFQKLAITRDPWTVAKSDPEIYCDLSAIAKGWAVDQIAGALVVEECSNFMVEVGGEVQTRGDNADGVPWRIAIETPTEGRRDVYAIVSLSGLAMATSGDYRNFYDTEGSRLSHTIDPRTGKPITHNLASVSVVHVQCALADAYATALMVMGGDEGYRWAQERDLAAFFITREPDGTIEHRMTDAFAPYLAEIVVQDVEP